MDFARKESGAEIQPLDEVELTLADTYFCFRRRLFEDLFPLWSSLGVDRVQGGFCESISKTGNIPPVNRRIRVSARQIYVFSEGARLGLNAVAATSLILHGHHFLQRHSNHIGLIRHNITHDGHLCDTGYDLYDQAFLLLSHASAYRHLRDREFLGHGLRLLTAIRDTFGHANGGFVDHTERPFPLRANPHMHLLEAALAWMAVDNHLVWRHLADEIVELFKTRFFDPHHGVVHEIFSEDWQVIEEKGRSLVEPGHNYEWAWLLMRWQDATGGEIGGRAHNMISFAETFGYDANRHVAVNECWSDGLVKDHAARLWPQTERLKAWIAVANACQDAIARREAEGRALDAIQAILSYLPPHTGGIWHDVMLMDGTFKECAAPASSLYHILCAFSVLSDYLEVKHDRSETAEVEQNLFA